MQGTQIAGAPTGLIFLERTQLRNWPGSSSRSACTTDTCPPAPHQIQHLLPIQNTSKHLTLSYVICKHALYIIMYRYLQMKKSKTHYGCLSQGRTELCSLQLSDPQNSLTGDHYQHQAPEIFTKSSQRKFTTAKRQYSLTKQNKTCTSICLKSVFPTPTIRTDNGRSEALTNASTVPAMSVRTPSCSHNQTF